MTKNKKLLKKNVSIDGRLGIIEYKLTNMQRTIYIILGIIGSQFGIKYIPDISNGISYIFKLIFH